MKLQKQNNSTPIIGTQDNSTNRRPKRKRGSPKVFQCHGYGDCKMVFTRAEHLARHVRKHTGEKPFQCDTCLKFFSRIDNLKQHKESVHASIKGDNIDGNSEYDNNNNSNVRKRKKRNINVTTSYCTSKSDFLGTNDYMNKTEKPNPRTLVGHSAFLMNNDKIGTTTNDNNNNNNIYLPPHVNMKNGSNDKKYNIFFNPNTTESNISDTVRVIQEASNNAYQQQCITNMGHNNTNNMSNTGLLLHNNIKKFNNPLILSFDELMKNKQQLMINTAITASNNNNNNNKQASPPLTVVNPIKYHIGTNITAVDNNNTMNLNNHPRVPTTSPISQLVPSEINHNNNNNNNNNKHVTDIKLPNISTNTTTTMVNTFMNNKPSIIENQANVINTSIDTYNHNTSDSSINSSAASSPSSSNKKTSVRFMLSD
ncbi:Usv1p SCDLUD_001145 [Saccharomycodes ludwigii]|uniref:Usv1p n=1 Tax=Saccharomycodes ludwigii TaxID=36035 RepID=UPI001E87F98C|nr:hypothetical protein SCDLUD_001145 [Saccharomycodes ludwigii]KAH3903504.1 hypothetical protein SCDLUD_001145 [Saccharomycodes ludwigii]